MSFTVVRYKDGKPEAIKMSIWDAFKGVPDRKPTKLKPKLCTCCKKVHEKGTSDIKDSEGQKKDKPADAGSDNMIEGKSDQGELNGDAKKNYSNREEEPYTEEEKATVIEMKGKNATNAEILMALGRKSLSTLKSQWREINPANKGSGNDKEGKGDNEATKKKEEERLASIEKQKAEGRANKQAQKEAAKEPEKKKTKNEGKEKTEPKATGTTSNNMKAFAGRYDKQKWTAAASKHFDLTGQRISPTTARWLAEGQQG